MAYSKKTWVDNEIISADALNNMESGIEAANKGIPSAASKTKAGLVKMAATVSDVTADDAGIIGDQFVKEEIQKVATLADANKAAINTIIKVLKDAGIIANS